MPRAGMLYSLLDVRGRIARLRNFGMILLKIQGQVQYSPQEDMHGCMLGNTLNSLCSPVSSCIFPYLLVRLDGLNLQQQKVSLVYLADMRLATYGCGVISGSCANFCILPSHVASSAFAGVSLQSPDLRTACLWRTYLFRSS
jgi:hypothetical protein